MDDASKPVGELDVRRYGASVLALRSPAETWRRLPRLLSGLVLCGIGISLMVRSGLGLTPWDVLHEGLAERTGLGIGTVIIAVGVAVMLAWLPLRQRPGIGTVANALLIGTVVNLALTALPEPGSSAGRWAFMGVGVFLFGPGSGLYIGAGLGAGPRDGLMTGLAARGISLRLVRTGIEAAVLVIGVLLGGTVGIGTVALAVSIGPLVQFFLAHLTLPAKVRRPQPVPR